MALQLHESVRVWPLGRTFTQPPLLSAPSAPLPTADSGLCVTYVSPPAPRHTVSFYLLHWISTTALVMTQWLGSLVVLYSQPEELHKQLALAGLGQSLAALGYGHQVGGAQ